MQVYRFDYATRRLIDVVTLGAGDRDPKDPSRYMLPGDCTEIAPREGIAAAELHFVGGAWIVAAPPARSWADVQAEARAALLRIDRLALGCFKAGRKWPAAWREYETALGAIVAAPEGDPAVTLPVAPPDPLAPSRNNKG